MCAVVPGAQTGISQAGGTRRFVCAGMCPALGDGCDEGICKISLGLNHRWPGPSQGWWHLAEEPGRVGFAQPASANLHWCPNPTA